jgi:hypothetical protein
LDQLQKLKTENQKLKRENSRLRKELDRVEIAYIEQSQHRKVKNNVEVQGKRQCFQCGRGELKLFKFARADGPWYYRFCNDQGATGCTHRTRPKKWNKTVKE